MRTQEGKIETHTHTHARKMRAIVLCRTPRSPLARGIRHVLQREIVYPRDLHHLAHGTEQRHERDVILLDRTRPPAPR